MTLVFPFQPSTRSCVGTRPLGSSSTSTPESRSVSRGPCRAEPRLLSAHVLSSHGACELVPVPSLSELSPEQRTDKEKRWQTGLQAAGQAFKPMSELLGCPDPPPHPTFAVGFCPIWRDVAGGCRQRLVPGRSSPMTALTVPALQPQGSAESRGFRRGFRWMESQRSR